MSRTVNQCRKQYEVVLYAYCNAVAVFTEILDKMENGEIFSIEVLNRYTGKIEYYLRELDKCRKENNLEGGYNFSQVMQLQGCRLENGRLIGTDCTRAMGYARKWVHLFPTKDCTLYEMGTYLLFLEQYNK